MAVEPKGGSLNESHIHLVSWMCEELYELAEDHEDAAGIAAIANRMMTKGGTPRHRDLLQWLRA